MGITEVYAQKSYSVILDPDRIRGRRWIGHLVNYFITFPALHVFSEFVCL
jgi:hypothetical protein